MKDSFKTWIGILSVFILPNLLFGQSLEDKVSQARKLQAQSLLGMDQQSLDSMVEEKKAQSERTTGRKPSKATESAILDSLIEGPKGMDTAADKGKNRLGARGQPQRYEQRLFQNANSSMFGSHSGAVGRDYVLGPGDAVVVSLWGDKEREYILTLNDQGKVFLEGIGLVPLAGNNISEAEKKLKERLARIYSGIGRGTAHVDVSLGKAGPIKVFVLGEVKVPGGYVFSGNTSVMSAMYFAKGPTDIGTVRNLMLNRSGKKYPLDLYNYLIKGETLSPDVLQDGDILFAGRAEALVEIDGDVGRSAVFELKKGEGIRELLEFAGQLNPTAASQKMTLQRIFPGGKVDFIDLPPPQDFISGKTSFELKDGDRILVEKSSELSKNFVTVSGPVKYPGTYALEGSNSVDALLEKAGGLREDAFLGRVHVVRFKPDGSSLLFAYALDSAKTESITLEPRDNVILYSVKEMFIPDSVEIAGAVFEPGKYEFSEGMTVKDLVMRAGGFLPHYEEGRIQVARGDPHERRVTHLVLDVQGGLDKKSEHFPLRKDDFVQVPIDPRWYKKEIVTLDGLFIRPGKYALLYPGEKLASVIDRAGGFKDGAYVAGGRLFRSKNAVGRIGVNIHKAMKTKRGKANLPLVGGDSIFIPEKLNTIKVVGEVGFETSVLHKAGKPVSYYIEKAGGFTRRSEKNRVVVEYANGETSRDSYFNRKPDAGSVIFVPQGPEPEKVDWFGGTNAILGTLTAGLTIILLINQLSRD